MICLKFFSPNKQSQSMVCRDEKQDQQVVTNINPFLHPITNQEIHGLIK